MICGKDGAMTYLFYRQSFVFNVSMRCSILNSGGAVVFVVAAAAVAAAAAAAATAAAAIQCRDTSQFSSVSINQSINQSITLLSLKGICIVQLMIYNIWDGHNKMQVNSRCIHYKNSSTG